MSAMNISTNEQVLVERDGYVATVTLNRPQKLNALNKYMWARVGEIFCELDADLNLRCVILRGAGDKAVGSGADISEFEKERNNSEQAAAYGRLMHGALHAIRDCRHPVLARIRGLCLGGALELALACDIRIAGESSSFGIPINKLGLVMAAPEIEVLVSLVGPSVALEILYESRIFDAAEAREKGLINRVVPDGDVDREIAETIDRICAGAPLVNQWHKKFVYGTNHGSPLSDEDEAESFECFDTGDFQEGVRAFLAKNKPNFKGN